MIRICVGCLYCIVVGGVIFLFLEFAVVVVSVMVVVVSPVCSFVDLLIFALVHSFRAYFAVVILKAF